jgi:hypothetical protein
MKIVLLAFEGETMCFVHVLLNALDLAEKDHDVAVIIEGAATQLIAELADPSKPFAKLYAEVKERGLVKAVCKACASKMGALDAAKEQELPIVGDMKGHPALEPWLTQGYQVITF